MGLITHDELKRAMSYDSETGYFRWLQSKGCRKAGMLAGTSGKHRLIMLDRKLYKAHRLAWLYVYGSWPVGQIDHIDGDSMNNKINNLRDVSSQVNGQNRHRVNRQSALGFMGVSAVRLKSGAPCFMTQIRVGKACYYLGVYKTPQEAATVYMQAKLRLHKGFMPTAMEVQRKVIDRQGGSLPVPLCSPKVGADR